MAGIIRQCAGERISSAARCVRPVACVLQVPRIAFRAACLAMHNARNAATYIRNVSPPFFAFGRGPCSKVSGSAWETLKPSLLFCFFHCVPASFKTPRVWVSLGGCVSVRASALAHLLKVGLAAYASTASGATARTICETSTDENNFTSGIIQRTLSSR